MEACGRCRVHLMCISSKNCNKTPRHTPKRFLPEILLPSYIDSARMAYNCSHTIGSIGIPAFDSLSGGTSEVERNIAPLI